MRAQGTSRVPDRAQGRRAQEGAGLLKMVLMGDSGSGKSSLARRYMNSEFHLNEISTIGVDFHFKNLLLGREEVKLQIWDTTGQSNFETLVRSYYRGAHICALVFDLTNRRTLDSLRGWHSKFLESGNAQVVIAVGNKCDQPPAMEWEEIDQVLEELGIELYIEVSAKTGAGVVDLFEECAKEAWRLRRPGERVDIIHIESFNNKKGCCVVL